MLVFFLCIGSFVELLFEGALIAFGTAVADIRRPGKLRTNIFLVEIAGGDASATCGTRSVGVVRTDRTDFLFTAQVLEGEPAVIKVPAKAASFLKADMAFNFF